MPPFKVFDDIHVCFISRKQVAQLFDFVDIDASKEIEYKEFLVALTTGHVLDTIGHAANFDDNASITLEGGLQTTSNEIKNVLNLIVSAYLLFDPNGRGFIERGSVGNMINEGTGNGKDMNTNAMLSKERWDEMVGTLISVMHCTSESAYLLSYMCYFLS